MEILDYLLLGSNNPCKGYIEFKSSDHIRYQHGMDVSGHNYNCNRTIRIEKNISGNEGYTVSIINNDGIHPLWGSNVQMAPKQMKVIGKSLNKISLRGWGCDRLGASFSDYGITIEFSDKSIDCITLHMFDRSVDIKYFR